MRLNLLNFVLYRFLQRAPPALAHIVHHCMGVSLGLIQWMAHIHHSSIPPSFYQDAGHLLYQHRLHPSKALPLTIWIALHRLLYAYISSTKCGPQVHHNSTHPVENIQWSIIHNRMLHIYVSIQVRCLEQSGPCPVNVWPRHECRSFMIMLRGRRCILSFQSKLF